MVSPFSCFSPSYHETLPSPKHGGQTNARPSIPQFSPAGLPLAPPSPGGGDYQRSRGKSMDLSAGNRQAGLSAKASRRRSAGPGGGGKRISKDLIGAPTNFAHVGGSGSATAGVSAGGGAQTAETDRSLAAIRAAMGSPSSPSAPKPLPSTSASASSLPLNDQTNSRPLTPSSRPLAPSPKPSPVNVRQRKPPPPITASVIRQAGPEAVAASHRPTSPVPNLPVGFVPHPLLAQTPPAVEEKEKEAPKEQAPTPKQPQSRPLYDEQGRLLQRDPAGGYMTATAKGRFDVGMKALEEALKLD